ncbi:MAG: energy-coupling factor transporter ATPase [Bacilli bacterium]|jgi:energy-coupling factor transport system ATP-binding protein
MSVIFKAVTYTYLPKTPYEHQALRDINLTLDQGKFIAIIGHTGSGKSTLVQHINALLTPSTGEVQVDDFVIHANDKPKGLKKLRKKAGMVFQFPEYQLFEETVYKDIMFGPKNFKEDTKTIDEKIHSIIQLVGLDESFLERSPFELSGGQKRRVAIAGILAMEPDILILDEPTAGLDPRGASEMMQLFQRLNRLGKTIILVTHEMDYVLQYCDEAIVLKDGQVAKQASPAEVFSDESLLQAMSIEAPDCLRFAKKLQKAGLSLDLSLIRNTESLAEAILQAKGVQR